MRTRTSSARSTCSRRCASRRRERAWCSPPRGGAVYGDATTPPNVETFAKNPESPYAVAKLAVEPYLAYYATRAWDRVRRAALRERVRPAAGSARRGGRGRDLLRAPARRLAADGVRRRTADARLRLRGRRGRGDVARGDAPLPAAGLLDARAFNVGTGVATTVLTLAKNLSRARGHDAADRARAGAAGRAAHVVPRRRQGGALLGWRAGVTLSDGLRQSFDGSRGVVRAAQPAVETA